MGNEFDFVPVGTSNRRTVDHFGGPPSYAPWTATSFRKHLTTMPIIPYTGPFGRPELQHLLRRTLFGCTVADRSHFEGMSLAAVVDELLAFTNDTTPPVRAYTDQNGDPNGIDPAVPFGSTWVETPITPLNDTDIIEVRIRSARKRHRPRARPIPLGSAERARIALILPPRGAEQLLGRTAFNGLAYGMAELRWCFGLWHVSEQQKQGVKVSRWQGVEGCRKQSRSLWYSLETSTPRNLDTFFRNTSL